MFKFLKEVVGGSGTGIKDLPYNIGEPYPSAWGSWLHHRGTSKDDGSPVSIFSLSGSNAQDGHLAAGRNGVKRLRTGGTSGRSGTNDRVHGNVCLASVVVTQTLDWKLHAFDVLSEFDGSNETSSTQMLHVSIIDAPLNLGCLIYELFSGLKLSKTEELRNTASIPKSLLPDYQRLLSSTPSRRLNTSKLIENSEYFQNKLVDTIHFMEILSLKDSVEKDTFFRKLPNLAEQLPRQIVLKKLLPLLASALEFGSAAAPALTALLKMGSWLSAEEFRTKVLPTIIKLFASNDRAVRVSLLQHIDQYGESLSAQAVDEQVYPHVATGFSDTSAFLRELTLKSMLVLAPKVDEEPAIRTNTTILLGNIASYLNEGTRKRVLINAFTVRALRDTFPPARGAGIMALCATSSNYDITEIATRILPNVVVLTIDPDSDVRSKAFQAVDQFLQMAKQHYEKTNIETTGGAGMESSSIPGNASLLGWAMSSLTLKGKSSDHAPVPSVSSTALTPTSSNASSVADTPSTAPIRVNSTPDFTEHHTPTSPTSTDGWGELENGIDEEPENDKDGWDDLEPLEETNPTPALTNIQAAQRRPVAQPASHVKGINH
ncbi:hypothetical protein TSUD_140870 [Trifolium subterraneum]|uniref:Protein kinase domain-containing protein n=1 Tax=Trifolium subterraneum TaxID=3900 RepID=A0A2Z6P2T9_TRISU|nr:hypothetical protein TSUD_140870 [Trifolium subterraneum]